ncbi:MAG TPA: hypothetical protein VM075_09135 [Anaerolineae bacterium]|nr:hypothetical protein [Anaerolineae bacterium]
MTKIVICDDDPEFASALEEAAKEGLTQGQSQWTPDDIVKVHGNELNDSVVILDRRRQAARANRDWPDETTPFDHDSLLIVDYDLRERGGVMTGETLAYLARCFSGCDLIIGVNQFNRVDFFDLTLKGHLESWADLNIGWPQLRNPRFWGGSEPGFRPWYWPSLTRFQRHFQQRCQDVQASLPSDAPIWQILGLTADLFEMLPRSMGEFIGADPATTTFLKFALESGEGLEPRDAEKRITNPDVLARVGAARISKWLERWLLPRQDILVDAPHLVARYPSLLTGDRDDIETWDATARLANHNELGLNTEQIEAFRMQRQHWLSRPAWIWDSLRASEQILEVREPWRMEMPDWVFCEDTSRFRPRDDCRSFVAAVESPFALRFVEHIDDVEYRPQVRFSL